MTAQGKGQGLEGGEREQKGERTQGCGHQCGDCSGAGQRGINGNGKNTIKNFKKRNTHTLWRN